jgi:hypothetical protein
MADLELAQNLNILGNNNFHFEILELPGVSLFAQTFSIPGSSLGRAPVPNSNVDYNVPGEKMEFEDLVITFMVDEYLSNYMEVFNWMVALGFPQSTEQFRALKEHRTPYTETSDIVLTTTTNKFNPAVKLHFVDCFPTDLSPIDFTNVDVTVTPVQATVTFDYSYYYFEPLIKKEDQQ